MTHSQTAVSAPTSLDVQPIAQKLMESAIEGGSPIGLRVIGGPGCGKSTAVREGARAAFSSMGLGFSAGGAPQIGAGHMMIIEFSTVDQGDLSFVPAGAHSAGQPLRGRFQSRSAALLDSIREALSTASVVALTIDNIEHAPAAFQAGLAELMAAGGAERSRLAVFCVSDPQDALRAEERNLFSSALSSRFHTIAIEPPRVDAAIGIVSRLADRRAPRGQDQPAAKPGAPKAGI